MLLWALAEDIRTLIRLTAALKQGQSVQSVRDGLRLWGDRANAGADGGAAHQRRPLAGRFPGLSQNRLHDRGRRMGNAWAEFKHLTLELAA